MAYFSISWDFFYLLISPKIIYPFLSLPVLIYPNIIYPILSLSVLIYPKIVLSEDFYKLFSPGILKIQENFKISKIQENFLQHASGGGQAISKFFPCVNMWTKSIISFPWLRKSAGLIFSMNSINCKFRILILHILARINDPQYFICRNSAKNSLNCRLKTV